jgi:hypothetical protein
MDRRARSQGAAAPRDEGGDGACLVEHGRPRSRRQRHGRKRLEKHGQGCAAGSAAVSMGRADTVIEPMTWRDAMIVAAISALLAAAITVALGIVIENLTF